MSTATTPQTEPPSASKPKLSARDRNVLDSAFSLDSRALAVVRILLAGLILFEAFFLEWNRPRDPQGPIEFLNQYGDVIVIPFALMLLVGWKTRIAVVLCWLAYSLRIRSDLFTADINVDVGDYILTLALFWSMFLPVGRHLSLDSRHTDQKPVRFLSVASVALLFQIFIIYFSAGLTKDVGEWVIDATAMETILANPTYETPLGLALLDYPALLAVMSVGTIVLELVGSIMVIVPGKSLATRRLVVVPMFIALHVGIAAFMGIGLFPYVCIAVWLVFLPPVFWDRVWGFFTKRPSTTVPLTDKSKWRNSVAGVAVLIAAVSNIITWVWFPNVEGVADQWQTMATFLCLYQQWAMFSVPSSLA